MGMNHSDEMERDSNPVDSVQQAERFPALSDLPAFMLSWVENHYCDLITVWDHEGRILFISKSVEEMLGYDRTELAGTKWYEWISKEDGDYIKSNFNHDSNNSQTYTINLINKYGKYIWAECIAAKLYDKHKKDHFYIASVKDISDKKETEEMMIRSEKMSIAGQLAAGVAHEIRNPLTSLKGFIQLLQAGVSRKEEYYNIMIEEIEKMETITSELLFVSKPLTDNKRNEPMEKMLQDIIVLLNPQAKLKGIDIKYHIPGNIMIYCDRSQIKQVLINLVKNAIEAMDEPGKIQLNAASGASGISLSIIDEGSGIPEELIHKLGEPFFTTKQSGTGLGIMISKQILEQHGATLEIKQNNEKGSTFIIHFPVQS
jgi:two-component system sporulation sensor kinase A